LTFSSWRGPGACSTRLQRLLAGRLQLTAGRMIAAGKAAGRGSAPGRGNWKPHPAASGGLRFRLIRPAESCVLGSQDHFFLGDGFHVGAPGRWSRTVAPWWLVSRGGFSVPLWPLTSVPPRLPGRAARTVTRCVPGLCVGRRDGSWHGRTRGGQDEHGTGKKLALDQRSVMRPSKWSRRPHVRLTSTSGAKADIVGGPSRAQKQTSRRWSGRDPGVLSSKV
jgi:hypothetical protein